MKKYKPTKKIARNIFKDYLAAGMSRKTASTLTEHVLRRTWFPYPFQRDSMKINTQKCFDQGMEFVKIVDSDGKEFFLLTCGLLRGNPNNQNLALNIFNR